MNLSQKHDFEEDLRLASSNLVKRLSEIDLHELGISEYNIRYISTKLNNPSSNLGLYIDLLRLCFNSSDYSNISKKTLIDYGGGSGLFSLLAKALGVGTVIYNDIYDVSCRDVKIIADAIDLPLDGMICGEIDDVIANIQESGLKVDAICSFDVIEHIYDINGYLRKCANIPHSTRLRLVFGSGANGRNPIINYRLRKKHLVSEMHDREKKIGHKERDSLKSYFNLRKEIIRNNFNSLPEDILSKLASCTRGLRKEDILDVVLGYIQHGDIIYAPSDKTNTCDPLTGNWDEHIMNPSDISSALEQGGFDVEILPGFWRGGNSLRTRIVKNILNILIKYTGIISFAFSPYYVVKADKFFHSRY